MPSAAALSGPVPPSSSAVNESLDALRALVALAPETNTIQTNPRELIETLAALGCTTNEIALVLRYDEPSLKELFAAEIQRGDAVGKLSLRRAQFRVALSGNPQMLKHLGETLLGQVPGLNIRNLGEDADEGPDPRETLRSKLEIMHKRIMQRDVTEAPIEP